MSILKLSYITRIFVFTILTTTIFITDIFLKNLVFSIGDIHLRILDALYIMPIWNNGASFGLFSEVHNGSKIIVLITIILLILITRYVFIWNKISHKFAASFVIGGSLGNMYDRMVFGAVRDFIDIRAFNYHMPTFNLADLFIFIGILIVLISDVKIK